MKKCAVTGIYRSPDGTHHRYKAGKPMPDGYELVYTGEVNDLPEVVAEARAEAAAPENKAEKPPKAKDA